MALVPIPLATGTDEGRSRAFASQRLVNAYIEAGRTGSKSRFCIHGTPGLRPWAVTDDGPIRGQIAFGSDLYVVSGGSFVQVDSGGIPTRIGDVSGTVPVIMAQNGAQIAIAAPDTRAGYVYNVSAASFGSIADADFPGATSVDYMDGYFIWSGEDGQFFISAVDDGTSYDGLDFATAESQPDSLTRVFVTGSQVWMMGPDTIEPWYNSGNSDFPFERMTQAVMTKGLAGRYTPVQVDNTVFWLGNDPDAGGGAQVYRADGYRPQVISTPAIEKILEGTTASTAIGVSYKQEGHLFYGLILNENAAIFYDVTTGEWAERVTYGLDRWLGANMVPCYGKTLVGSYTDGQIYELDHDYIFDGDDTPLVMDVTLPPVGNDAQRAICASLVLDLEKGVGLTTGQGSDPQIMMRYSDDQGRTWSNELWRSMGAIGDGNIRVRWNRLGQFYTRVFRFIISDPVKRVLIACWGDIV